MNTLHRWISLVTLVPLCTFGQVLKSSPKETDTLQERFAGIDTSDLPDTLSPTIATILDGDENLVAAATVVSRDGWLVAKASEWPEDGQIQLASGSVLAPDTVRTNAANDLVFLHIPETNLTPISFGSSPNTDLGHWIMAYQPTVDRWVVGVRSAIDRKSEREGGVIGVIMGHSGNHGVYVRRVFEESGAAEAGIKRGDWLTAINEDQVKTTREVQEFIQAHDAGARIDVTITRDGEEQTLNVLLGHRTVIFDVFNRNQMMSGPTSARRSGFSQILQHDLPLSREWSGLPLFDLEGNCVGINIARLNRVESFALPASLLKTLVAEQVDATKAP